MTLHAVISECRTARDVEGARWPAPLVAFLNDPPNEKRVFDWLISVVAYLLNRLGKMSPQIEEVLARTRQQTADDPDRSAIERAAWDIWSRRSREGPAFTAIAQLLFVLARSDRVDLVPSFAAACATPICLLEQLEQEPGQVFDLTVEHFSSHVRGT